MRQSKIRGLNAVAKFKQGNYDSAIDDFLSLEINPAKVVALFPESISGRLHVAPDNWTQLYGGPPPKTKEETVADGSTSAQTSRSPRRTPSPSSSVPRAKNVLSAIKQSAGKDDDAASIRSVRRDKSVGEAVQ